jgi:hypothetical protein
MFCPSTFQRVNENSFILAVVRWDKKIKKGEYLSSFRTCVEECGTIGGFSCILPLRSPELCSYD